MDVELTQEAEAKLNDLALRTGRGTDELLSEAVNHLLSYNEWFEEKVRDSQRAVARGEIVGDDEVRRLIEKRERT
jgi:predicted transcriptional regulator